MKKVRLVFLMTFAFLLLLPLGVFAQGGDELPEGWIYVALAFNVGIVGMLVQILKLKVLPILKRQAPYLIPLLGMVIGVATAWILQNTGIDVSPIGDVFGPGIVSGALASTAFAVVKEGQNKFKLRRRRP